MAQGRLLLIGSLVCTIAFGSSVARAQHHHDESGGTPATLRSDLGSLHHPIATTSEEAQKFFDQGLTLDYAFNHGQAVRSFRRAAELDPKSPMPYWGMALALGPNYNETRGEDEKGAYEAIQKAKELAASAPEGEREYVNALARRFSNDAKPDYDKLARDYAAAMRELSHHYPDDPDAGTLFAESLMDQHAWALWTNDGKPAENTLEIVATLESVLRRWPDHAGANHFYIHAMEMSPDPGRAMPSADRLGTLVPGGGHLVHMPSHIYIRTGDYAAAVKSNQQAVAVDNNTPRPPGGDMSYMIYRAHNVHFLAAAAMMDGEFDVATAAAKDLASRANAVVGNMPMAQDSLPYQLFVELRFARWDDVLAAPPTPEKLNGLALFWHYARGVAFAEKGQPAQAEAEQAAMEAVYKQIAPGPAFGSSYNGWATVHDVAAQTLAARIAAARGYWAGPTEQWRAAVAVQDKMNYDEPADWYSPVRESLGAALLRSGKGEEAEQVFRADLEQNRRNPRSLFGLWKSLEAQNKTVDAQWTRQSFEAAWKGGPDQLRLADF